MKIVVLGAGFGGLELTTTLSETLGEELEITLIDRNEGFVFGFSKLDVMFGVTTAPSVIHSYSKIKKPGVTFIQTNILSIDPINKRVQTEAGIFDADILVIALGADLDPLSTPGLVEYGNEFYSVEGAFALRQILADFRGGNVVIGVTSAPFKCPPAPSETALLMHDFLTNGGMREKSTISLVIPFGVPIPPSPEASTRLVTTFDERNINWYSDRRVTHLETDPNVAVLSDGTKLPFDLFLGIPTHVAPKVVLDSGMTSDGWIPVNSLTLETQYPNVYAIGDVTSVGTPKAGVFSEGQAGIAATQIIARIQGKSGASEYDGRGICYLEFGNGEVAQVEVTFVNGEKPYGNFAGPSPVYSANKKEFGSSRIQRWFD